MEWLSLCSESLRLAEYDAVLTNSCLSRALNSRWAPVLDGSLKERALEAIDAIASALLKDEYPEESQLGASYPFSLGFGTAGIALFFAYLSKMTGCSRFESASSYFLKTATAALASHKMLPDLYCGFSGIGWVHEHLLFLFGHKGFGDACEELDDALIQWCSAEGACFELLRGIAGVLVYAVERTDGARVGRMLSEAISRLDEGADEVMGGRAWRLRRQIVREYVPLGASLDRPLYGLGVAHGVTGIIGALALVSGCAHLSSSNRARALRLLQDSTRWLVSNYSSTTSHCFPNIVSLDLPRRTTGWCNGDLGISSVLFQASIVLNNEKWCRIAETVAAREALKNPGDIEWFNRLNYTLCHGSAGRAHILNRVFQQTGNAQFADRARKWFEHTLSLRRAKKGTGGFLVDEPQIPSRKNVLGLLMGASGLALSLISAISSLEPCWDRLLLTSRPGIRFVGEAISNPSTIQS